MKNMTYINILFLFLLISCISTGEKTDNNEKGYNTKKLPFPSIKLNYEKNSNVQAIVDGIITRIETDEYKMKRIFIKTSIKYYYKDNIQEDFYELVIGGLLSVNVNIDTEVKNNAYLGISSSNTYITSRVNLLNPFMVRTCYSKPVKYNEYWWFLPEWLLPETTLWLSFRPVKSFEEATKDFYQRWVQENQNPIGSTIHYFDNLDRIRAVIKLNKYPDQSKLIPALELTEEFYYQNSHIFVLQNLYNNIDGYDVIIYWQKDFDKYLIKEYKLGDDLYIYASIYSLDHDNKKIIVCVIDFSLTDDESIINERIKIINSN